MYDESLVGRRLERIEQHTLASAAGYLKRRGTPTHPRELIDHALIGYFSTVTGSIYPYTFERNGEQVAFAGPFAASFNDANAFLAAGDAGLGIFQAPAGPWVHASVASGRVVRILADWDAGFHVHTILYPSRRQLPARVAVFVAWALERFGDGTVAADQ